jgi:hypothetical protein
VIGDKQIQLFYDHYGNRIEAISKAVARPEQQPIAIQFDGENRMFVQSWSTVETNHYYFHIYSLGYPKPGESPVLQTYELAGQLTNPCISLKYAGGKIFCMEINKVSVIIYDTDAD